MGEDRQGRGREDKYESSSSGVVPGQNHAIKKTHLLVYKSLYDDDKFDPSSDVLVPLCMLC